MDIINTISNLLVKDVHIAADSILPQSRLVYDLGLNSYDLVVMSCELENFYNIDLSDIELSRLETVHDIIEVVALKMQTKTEVALSF